MKTVVVALAVYAMFASGASPGFAEPPRGASTAPVAAAALASAELAGAWTGTDWGRVNIAVDGSGSYTSTYGTGPGRLELRRTDDHTYVGAWRESSQRFGTLRLTLSPDGRVATGSWTPDPQCTIGTTTGGPISWTRP